ncbi:hypothetical protein LEP1GSC043_3796 [Leptospira weilii str. Ecochallenge]|uniref:Uncharacterized protein n=1 Tax=Leptospira weilii str. Ecochallenge TaxID=1049986 RepID=N1TZR8_9LEPT|nr:hypothetical protein LEP1GSC043_3796 [Leptospira weilii str. Ecochallenge]
MRSYKQSSQNINHDRKRIHYLVVPEKVVKKGITKIKCYPRANSKKQNHRKDSPTHRKRGENETRRKLKTPETKRTISKPIRPDTGSQTSVVSNTVSFDSYWRQAGV